jgi:hypothetical protein
MQSISQKACKRVLNDLKEREKKKQKVFDYCSPWAAVAA